jgi:hypothetical protein
MDVCGPKHVYCAGKLGNGVEIVCVWKEESGIDRLACAIHRWWGLQDLVQEADATVRMTSHQWTGLNQTKGSMRQSCPICGGDCELDKLHEEWSESGG